MSLEVLYILSKKEAYNRYAKLISNGMSSNEVVKQIISDMHSYYQQHDVLDWEEFSDWFNIAKHPNIKDNKRDEYNRIFDRMASIEEDELPLLDDILHSFIARDYGKQLADLSWSMAEEGVDNSGDISTLLDSFNEAMGTTNPMTSNLVTTSLADIVRSRLEGEGYKWRLNCLNRSIGSLRKGMLIIIGARVETGKSTFLCSETTYMAAQMSKDKSVLWFNNEEDGEKVKYRIIQSSLGWSNLDIDSQPDLAEEKSGWHKFNLYDKGEIHKQEVITMCKELKPGLVVFDQLHKIRGFDNEGRDDIKLQKLAAMARDIAKEYCPVMVIHQADATAEGQKWIGQNQFAGNKTTLPGEADAIIMIGKEDDSNLRYINIPKNKLGGSVPSERYGKYTVTIKGDTARYTDEY